MSLVIQELKDIQCDWSVSSKEKLGRGEVEGVKRGSLYVKLSSLDIIIFNFFSDLQRYLLFFLLYR